jgi:hypothetical protein
VTMILLLTMRLLPQNGLTVLVSAHFRFQSFPFRLPLDFNRLCRVCVEGWLWRPHSSLWYVSVPVE